MADEHRANTRTAEDFLNGERRRLHTRKAKDKTLFVRNILNSVFIIMALVAMVGVLVAKPGTDALHISYGLGITAILVKMAEVMMRMPTMLRKPEYEKRKDFFH